MYPCSALVTSGDTVFFVDKEDEVVAENGEKDLVQEPKSVRIVLPPINESSVRPISAETRYSPQQ